MRRDLPPTNDIFTRLKDDLQPKVQGSHKSRKGHSTSLVVAHPGVSPQVARHGSTLPASRSAVYLEPLSAQHRHSPLVDDHPRAQFPLAMRQNHHTSGDVPLPIFTDEATIPLESQKQTLITWMRHYADELASVDSSAMAAEVLLAQVTVASSPAAPSAETHTPHPLRLAAVCAIAENVCDVVGRFRPLLRPVLDELYRSVYLPQGTAAPRQELVASRMVTLGIQPAESVRLQQFLARKPYFEQSRDLASAVESLERQILALSTSKAAGRSVLERLGMAWSSTVAGMVFRAWRGAAQRARSQNAIMNRFLANVQRKDKLEAHFYAWRLVVKDQQLARSREEYSRSIDQLVQLEANTNVKYLEVDDQLYESRMVVARLKVEKDLQKLEREQLQHATEASLVQAEGWRNLTSDVISFMASLRKHMTSTKPLIGVQNLQAVTDTALHTLLGWAGKLIEPLPQASKLKRSLTNFSNDMKDGTLLVLLVHVLTKGEVDLRVLQDIPDARGRLQVVLDAMGAPPINIILPFTIEDVYPPTPEMNYLLLYMLWCYFEAPPIPGADTALGFTGAYRDDVEETQKFLERAKSFYPSWLERRHLLQQYTLFVLAARIKNLPPQVLTDIEATERDKVRDLFSLTSTVYVPSAFLSGSSLTASQRFQNEEERDRVNDVLQRHLGVVRHLFERYASRASPLSESIAAAQECDRKARLQAIQPQRPSRKATLLVAGRGNQGNMTMPPTAATISDSMYRDVFVEIDVMGFYRLCCDAGVCVRGQAPAAPTRGAAQQRKDNRKKEANQILSEPRNLTKLQIFEIYVDTMLKWPSTDRSDPDPTAAPAAFVTLLVNLAVNRYGQPLTKIQQPTQPAPAGALMELFLKKDLTSAIGVVDLPTSFLRQVFHPTVQEKVFFHRRMILRAFFEQYCTAPATNTAALGPTKSMSLRDFVKVCVEIFPQELQDVTGMTATLATVESSAAGSTSAEPPLAGSWTSIAANVAEPTAHTDDGGYSSPFPTQVSPVKDVVGPLGGVHSVAMRAVTLPVIEETFEDAVLCMLPILPLRMDHTPHSASPASPASPTTGSPAAMSPEGSFAGSPYNARPIVPSSKAFAIGALEPEELRMVYGEFEIALAAISQYVEPSPFIGFQEKLVHFLDHRVLSSPAVQSIMMAAA